MADNKDLMTKLTSPLPPTLDLLQLKVACVLRMPGPQRERETVHTTALDQVQDTAEPLVLFYCHWSESRLLITLTS